MKQPGCRRDSFLHHAEESIMADTNPLPGDRVLAELAARHAEIERALGHPGPPLTITPEVRSIAAAAERALDAARKELP
jgi:hypothetical protein